MESPLEHVKLRDLGACLLLEVPGMLIVSCCTGFNFYTVQKNRN